MGLPGPSHGAHGLSTALGKSWDDGRNYFEPADSNVLLLTHLRPFMENIIVYIDDAGHALQMLQPLLAAAGNAELQPDTHWILVGCAPRVTHRVSKWVTHSARDNWRRKWADKVFSQIVPTLASRNGNGNGNVTTLVADTSLGQQTEWLIQQHGAARVLDARRPRLDVNTPTVRPQRGYGFLSLLTTVLGTGMLIGID
jgi:hypothetical protein